LPRAPKGAPKAKPWARAKAGRRLLSPDEQWAEELSARILAGAHPKQRAFILDPGKRITALVGRGGGKTTGGVARFIRCMSRIPKAKCLYIAPTKQAAREIIWDKLKEIFERSGVEATFSETQLRVTMTRTGSQLRLVGADDMAEVDKLRGKPYHEVGIDEAAAIRPNLLEALVIRAISPRLGDYDGCLWMISTPGHILKGLFYDTTRSGSDMHRAWADREDHVGWIGWSSHRWTLWDGAASLDAIERVLAAALVEKERNKWGDDHPIWRREFLGEWAADDTNNVYQYKAFGTDGKTPWNRWDPPRIGPLRMAKLPDGPTDWIHVLCADMGHSDPFSLHVLSASPSDPKRNVYHRYEFERTKMYARLIAELIIGEDLNADRPGGIIGDIGWPAGSVADMTHLGGAVLDELAHVYGIRFTAADQKDKFASIELMNGDLIDGRMHVLAGSKLEEQMLGLQWVEDEFGRLKENKGQANHATDAAIYGRRLLAVLFANEAPVPATPARTLAPRQAAKVETDELDPVPGVSDELDWESIGDVEFSDNFGGF
jgi:hypothetical protein